MRVYVKPPAGLSRAMSRVEKALSDYAPESVKVVKREEIADVVVLHVIDYNGVPEVIQRLKDRGQRFAIVQYCMRSTSKPNTKDWLDIWRETSCVWSYYDLNRLCVEDNVRPNDALEHFFFAPLGCDADVFTMRVVPPKYLVATSGYVAESESVDAVSNAVQQYDRDARQFHLGPDLGLGLHVVSKLDITDNELARDYSACEFVSGLRRSEGFELPIVEGFLCGARPITFDASHYREWFSTMAEFIPEGAAEDVTAHVLDIFQRGRREVTSEERNRITEVFDWATIAPDFWERAL